MKKILLISICLISCNEKSYTVMTKYTTEIPCICSFSYTTNGGGTDFRFEDSCQMYHIGDNVNKYVKD